VLPLPAAAFYALKTPAAGTVRKQPAASRPSGAAHLCAHGRLATRCNHQSHAGPASLWLWLAASTGFIQRSEPPVRRVPASCVLHEAWQCQRPGSRRKGKPEVRGTSPRIPARVSTPSSQMK